MMTESRYYITSSEPRTIWLLHSTRATVVAVTRDDDSALVRVRVTLEDIQGRRFGPFDIYTDVTHYDVGAYAAVRAHGPLAATGLTRSELDRIAETALRLAGIYCDRCQSTEHLDSDCFGERRCSDCDGPCAGCYSGEGPTL